MILSLPVAAPRVSDSTPYVAYAYSYPHKSAYGRLDPPVPLAPAWQVERRDALFLYFHIPFCEMRCGFCNLFARAGGDTGYIDAYIDAIERQAEALAHATEGNRRIVRLAIGGGTPTFLSPPQLRRLFDIAEYYFSASCGCVPASVETSPKTATADRLACLLERGVNRISIGIQSFFDADNRSIGRPQLAREVHAALERARAFSTLNIDLIYGQPEQTIARWLDSLRRALNYQPEELYLYPLYVRPGTGIGRRRNVQRESSTHMRELYREGRDLLKAAGYEQISMRYFRKRTPSAATGPVYCCQTDGMVGLGCGARSYTSGVHYSSRFAVEPAEVEAILDDWIQQTRDDFCFAQWGCRLSDDDRRRRFLIQSLLTLPGLDASDFARLFNSAGEIPELVPLIDAGFVESCDGIYRLTPLGFEFSDAIGPSLYSPEHVARLEGFAQW
jgi:oxygen-independent coproporphyrinogen III oxidase